MSFALFATLLVLVVCLSRSDFQVTRMRVKIIGWLGFSAGFAGFVACSMFLFPFVVIAVWAGYTILQVQPT
jgi:hypothetical protein